MPKWLCHLREPGPGAGLSGTSLSIAGDSLADIFGCPPGLEGAEGKVGPCKAHCRGQRGCRREASRRDARCPSAAWQEGFWSSTRTCRCCITDSNNFGLHLGKR